MQKLCHFINYLMLVNCQTQVSQKVDKEIENLSFLIDGNPWLKSLSENNKNFKTQLEKIDKDKGSKSDTAFLNPQYKKELLETSANQNLIEQQLI